MLGGNATAPIMARARVQQVAQKRAEKVKLPVRFFSIFLFVKKVFMSLLTHERTKVRK